MRCAARTADTDGVIAAAAEIVRRARLRGLGEDEPALYRRTTAVLHFGEAKFKQRPREEQAEADGSAGTTTSSPFRDCSVLFFSRPRSEGWPHRGRTFSIHPCPLSF